MGNERIPGYAGYVNQKLLTKGPNGRAHCRWCHEEVPKGRVTFCGDACIHEHKIRTNPGYVRELLLVRDKGVCAICKLDTIAYKAQQEAEHRSRYGHPDYRASRRSGWDADHVVPVCEGGGDCELDNYRTLCVPCHKEETKILAGKRAAAKRANKGATD